jgi:acyl carrier protein
MSARTVEQIYRDLAEVLAQAFPDRDISVAVGPQTRVLSDLGFASIELVVLGERLEQFYGRKLPFGQFLASLRNTDAGDLEVGTLVKFLQQHV